MLGTDMSTNVITTQHGTLHLRDTDHGISLTITPTSGTYIHDNTWTTRYSRALIQQLVEAKGLPYLIDEIRREEDPLCIERALKVDILSFIDQHTFSNSLILDFGCGSGASTMVLARLFPTATIIGVEITDRHLTTARKRAEFYGVSDRVTFLKSPDPMELPNGLPKVDHILFCAVFEHLLPEERPAMLRLLWNALKPGGHLFINDTPYRWFPVETHTTGLPFINYLPNTPAFFFARKASKRVSTTTSDTDLLRLGIRGGTLAEILQLLDYSPQKPTSLTPSFNNISNHINLWEQHSINARGHNKTKLLAMPIKFFHLLTGITAVPSLSLAIKKGD
jgi:2-polyprenyl-3-methyl-5-hydroxy-6-metoxy-1,4-benzoquinol methylase